jgi:hypothetical protein
LQIGTGITEANDVEHYRADLHGLADQRIEPNAACGKIAPALVRKKGNSQGLGNVFKHLDFNDRHMPARRRAIRIVSDFVGVAISLKTLTDNNLGFG